MGQVPLGARREDSSADQYFLILVSGIDWAEDMADSSSSVVRDEVEVLDFFLDFGLVGVTSESSCAFGSICFNG